MVSWPPSELPSDEMIGDTGLDSLLPGILLEAESDLDTCEENDERPSKMLKIKTEFDFESAIKTEMPDSCTDLYLMVGINLSVVFVLIKGSQLGWDFGLLAIGIPSFIWTRDDSGLPTGPPAYESLVTG